MSDKIISYAAKALLKLAQENKDCKIKLAQYEAKERALAVAHKLAEKGTIEYTQVLEKAASLAKEDLTVIEKAIDLNINSILDIGSAAVTKEASEKEQFNGSAKSSFEEFILSNFS